MNYTHHHHQVHWEEQLMEAAFHALGGNSSSKLCPRLPQDCQHGFPETLQLCLQLGWVLSGNSPYDISGLVPSTVIPLFPDYR